MNKKTFGIFLTTLWTVNIYATSLQQLLESAFLNNSDILTAKNNYESSLISSKTLDGTYSPSFSLSSSSTLPDKYSWENAPDYFSSSLTYSQPLPGGTTIGLSGSYSFTAEDLAEESYLSQSQNISFSITQSLLPFWVQGKLKDPSKLSFQQQKQYYYNQLLYTKKTVIQTIVQNYTYAVIYKNKAEIYENSISLLNEQISLLKKLKESGNTNQIKILELENSKWNYQENLATVQESYADYIQNLKTLCVMDFDENAIEDICETNNFNIYAEIFESIETAYDPLEENYKLKLEMKNNSRILEKQNYAPTINLTVQPSWSLNEIIQENWKDAWKNMARPTTWTASVSVNLSPLISGIINQNKKQYDLDYDLAVKSYNSYLKQRDYLYCQYEELFKQYAKQSENAIKLYQESLVELEDYETQYKAGAVSYFDYESVKIRVDNLRLSKKSIKMYEWMYNILLKLIFYRD